LRAVASLQVARSPCGRKRSRSGRRCNRKAGKSLDVLTCFRRTGVRLWIDDYGTGQSTLTCLRRQPATDIKIDKSFNTYILQNRSDEILVRLTIGLAHDWA
jgi:EAL domain-containing protein (putative c-di-GMP-specific phosphodiesterase class I)